MREYRLSVCKGPDCRENGSDPVFAHARAVLQRTGLAARCELYRGGCYGLCHLGPNVVLREKTEGPVDPFATEDFQLQYSPDEAYYWRMTEQKIEQVITEHVGQDRKVPALFGNPDEPEDFRAAGR